MNKNLSQLVEFIAEIGDENLTSDMRVLFAKFQRPGPVIVISGAEGRGKSTLTQRLLGLEKGAKTKVAHGQDWTASDLRDLPIKGPRCFIDELEDIVVIDSPAFDISESAQLAKTIIQTADLVLFVVQSTAPGCQDEVIFAKNTLADKPCILVLSKADQAEEELEEALDFAQSAFKDIHWLAVFVSGRVTEANRLEDWWPSHFKETVRSAKSSELNSKSMAIANAGLTRVDSKIEQLSILAKELNTTANKRKYLDELYDLKAAIRTDFNRINRLAAEEFSKQRGSYSTGFRAILNGALSASDPSVEVDLSKLAQDLNAFLIKWNKDVRSKVRNILQPTVESNYAKSMRFNSLLEQLSIYKTSDLKPFDSNWERDENLFHAPDIEMSEAERRRTVLSPILGASGTVLLGHTLLAFLGPVAWLVGAGVGLGVFKMNRDVQSEQNRRKLLNDLERAMTLQSGQVYNELEEQFARDWRAYTFSIEAQLAPALRAADIVERTEMDRSDVNPEIARIKVELTKWLDLRSKLLGWTLQ